MALTVIGTVALDSVESPFGKIEEGLGGSATHFSVSAAFFSPISLVAVIGDDFPEEHIQFLESRSIDIKNLKRLSGPSFRWTGRYDYDLNVAHTLDTQLNVLTQFDPVLNSEAKKNPFVFLANIDPKLQKKVITQVEGKPFVAADTMNFWIEGSRNELLEMLKNIDMLVINEAEARLLAQEQNLLKASQIIRGMGPKILLIKRGEYGALAFYEDKIFNAPALPLEDIQDPTGAGDSFAGGVMGYLAKTQDTSFQNLKKAMIYGSVMASFNVEKFSLDRLRTLTEAEIKSRYQQFCELSHFEGKNYLGE